jgi:predicted PurR-regulated permease PerM
MKSNYFLTIMLVITTYWLGVLYQNFLMTILIALLFSIATSNIYNKIMTVVKSEFLGAFLVSLLLASIFFAPLGYFIYKLVLFIQDINPKQFEDIIPILRELTAKIPDSLEFLRNSIEEWLSEENINNSLKELVKFFATWGTKSATFMKDALLIIVFYFFIQFYRNRLGRYFKRIIPLSSQDTVSLFKEISVVMGVVFYSIVVTAAFEGGLFAILAYFYDYNPLLLGILYGFSSLIPVVGGMLLWLPLGLYEISLGNYERAIFMVVYSIVVISIIADTFIKPAIIKYINDNVMKSSVYINELLIFFSMIAGLSTFGFWGMILGPAIITLFLSLIKLYEKLYKKDNTHMKINLKYSSKSKE